MAQDLIGLLSGKVRSLEKEMRFCLFSDASTALGDCLNFLKVWEDAMYDYTPSSQDREDLCISVLTQLLGFLEWLGESVVSCSFRPCSVQGGSLEGEERGKLLALKASREEDVAKLWEKILPLNRILQKAAECFDLDGTDLDATQSSYDGSLKEMARAKAHKSRIKAFEAAEKTLLKGATDDECCGFFAGAKYKSTDDTADLKDKKITVGIDMGTTKMCVAAERNGIVEILPLYQDRTTNSVIGINGFGAVQAGTSLGHSSAATLIYDVKRFLRRSYKATKRFHSLYPFEIVKNVKDPVGEQEPLIRVKVLDEFQLYNPVDVAEMLLEKVKYKSESYLGCAVDGTVITVPANFSLAQREDIGRAAKSAGLNVLHLMDEPLAAAVDYCWGRSREHVRNELENILVFDLGGGTLDVSLFTFGEDDVIQVGACKGDDTLGGSSFDESLMRHFAAKIYASTGYHIIKSPGRSRKEINTLRRACGRLKEQLSECSVAEFAIAGLGPGPKKHEYYGKVSRSELENVIASQVDRCISLVDSVLEEEGHETVSKVLLVGGSTKVPLIKRRLDSFFGNVNGKSKILEVLDKDACVATGAAMYASHLANPARFRSGVFLPVSPSAVYIECVAGFEQLIAMNQVLPAAGEVEIRPRGRRMDIRLYESCRLEGSKRSLYTSFQVTDSDIASSYANVEATGLKIVVEMDARQQLKVRMYNLENEEVLNKDVKSLQADHEPNLEDKSFLPMKQNILRQRSTNTQDQKKQPAAGLNGRNAPKLPRRNIPEPSARTCEPGLKGQDQTRRTFNGQNSRAPGNFNGWNGPSRPYQNPPNNGFSGPQGVPPYHWGNGGPPFARPYGQAPFHRGNGGPPYAAPHAPPPYDRRYGAQPASRQYGARPYPRPRQVPPFQSPYATPQSQGPNGAPTFQGGCRYR